MTPPFNKEESDRRLKYQVNAVRDLGDQIGYGQLMTLASALWRRKLKGMDIPTDGAFTTTILMFMDEESRLMAEKDNAIYDEIIETALK